MPEKNMGPSEFGGRIQANGVQPPPHEPTASEKLMLVYRTGDDTGLLPVDREGAPFEGLLPKKEQEELRKQAGDLNKGEIWQEMNP